MQRWHLFEFGDLRWFPKVLRDAETAYLATSYRFLRPLPRLWAEKISTVLDPGDPAVIVDLCSGSGGAIPLIIEELERRGYNVRATLTDLYPNPDSGAQSLTGPPSRIVWLTEPVDATRVPHHLLGVRTMFSAFHHFRPPAAKAILKDAFERRRPICIFEAGSGTLLNFGMALGVPFGVLLLMPFARPFRWSYFVFTYLIPLTPLILFWDVIVSYLRFYSPEQMRKLTEDLQSPDYRWDIGEMQVRGIPGGL